MVNGKWVMVNSQQLMVNDKWCFANGKKALKVVGGSDAFSASFAGVCLRHLFKTSDKIEV